MGNLSTLFFPAPSRILDTFSTLLAEGTLPSNLLFSLRRMVFGLAIGGTIGTVLGLVLGWSRPLREIFDPVIAAVHPIPKITIFPMIIIIFGLGEPSKLIVIALATFFPMLINSMAGVSGLSNTYFEVAQNYGMSRWDTLRRVVLPGSLPMILAGLRLALNSALVLTIVVEMLTSYNGLGDMVALAWATLRTHYLYATLIVIAALGVSFNLLVTLLMRRFASWVEVNG